MSRDVWGFIAGSILLTAVAVALGGGFGALGWTGLVLVPFGVYAAMRALR